LARSFVFLAALLSIISRALSIIGSAHFSYFGRSFLLLTHPFELLTPQFRITWVAYFGNSQLNGSTQGFAPEHAEKDRV
jgi:hypothetical protein